MTHPDQSPAWLLALGGAAAGAVVAVLALPFLGVPVLPVLLPLLVVAVVAVVAATAVALLLAHSGSDDTASRAPGEPLAAPPWDRPAARRDVTYPGPGPAGHRQGPGGGPPVRDPAPTQPAPPPSAPPVAASRPPAIRLAVESLSGGNGTGAPDGGGGPWWGHRPSRSGAAPAAAPPAPPPRTPPAFAEYFRDTVLAQCPRCGSFDVDYTRTGDDFAFTCRSCPHQWPWRLDQDWPAIDAHPRRRSHRSTGT